MSMLVCVAGGRYKTMASPERVCSWVDVRKDQENYLETPDIIDENTPLSPGEIEIMRNHSKISSKLCSPARKTSKQKPSFRVHGSPLPSTKLTTSSKGSLEKRKTLQVLQPAANGKGLLVGSSGIVRGEQKKDPIKSKSKTVKLQRTLKECTKSTAETSSDSDSSTQNTPQANSTENENEGFALMVQDPPPEKYWQLLAEERRIALQEALEENERLCKELEEQKELCRKLEEVAGQAEYFASLYHMVLEGEAPDLEDSDTGHPKSSNSRESNADDGDSDTS